MRLKSLSLAVLYVLMSCTSVSGTETTDTFYNQQTPASYDLGFIGSLQEIANSPEFKKVWKDFTDVCAKALGLATSKNRNKKNMLDSVIGRDPEYVRLIKEAQQILVGTQAAEYFNKIEEAQAEIKALKNRQIELKQQRISAPETSLNPFIKTVSDIDSELNDKIPQALENCRLMIQSYKDSLFDTLRHNGIEINEEQLEYFVVSAEGDDLIALMSLANNMKIMQQVMGNELKSGISSPEVAKKYAGMNLISLESYLMAHDNVIGKISTYIDKINDIIKNTESGLAEARSLLKDATEDEVQNLKANVRISEQTISAANMYKSILSRRTASLKEHKETVQRKIKIARNTYETINNGSALISLISKSSDDYTMIMNFKMPELENLYEPSMKEAFASISEKLKE